MNPLVVRRLVLSATAFTLAIVSSSPALGRSEATQIRDLDGPALDRRLRQDVRLLHSYATGVDNLIEQLHAQHRLWSRDKKTPLTPDERRLALVLFEQVLSYSVALDGMAGFHFGFWRIDPIRQAARHSRHFAVGFTAFCLKARLGLVFVEYTLNKPQFEKLLDEGSPAHGLAPGGYGRLKYNVVHVESVSRIMTAHQYHKLLRKTSYRRFDGNFGMEATLRILDATYEKVKTKLLSRGVNMFAGNAFDILRDGGERTWFPVQVEVAEWMGDTKVRRLDRMLISAEQVADAAGKSQPGDLIVERRNWYLSNIALPGFWPHAALWLGSPKELAAHFDTDPEVSKAYGGKFTSALEKRFAKAWKQYASADHEGHTRRIIEAVSEGVVFSSAEESIRADYVAAMRPRLSKLQVARAIERAFGYAGRPYDFNFDFFTDSSLVCSELVYKSYEPMGGKPGLTFELEEIVGRMTLGPNSMIKQFDESFGTAAQQLDFVWFLDGREKSRSAVWGDLTSFRASHKRYKWDIAQK